MTEDATRTNPTGSVATRAGGPPRFDTGAMLANRYRIVRRVGHGGMGDVYRADDLRLNVPVALKFLPDEVADDSDRLNRFHAEVRLARAVSHSNVCRVFDIVKADGHTFIAMEFVEGEDLAALLRRIGRLPCDKAVDFLRQICFGVAAAHQAGIVHRDLKPANIMIDTHGRVRITDFGLAGLSERLRAHEVKAGTPAYMAPEQIEHGTVTPRSDIYALGLILYEMVTGQRAFDGKSLAEIRRRHKLDTPTHASSLIPDIDPAVERVIVKCLEKDPTDRPPSAMAVAALLPGGDPLAAALAAGETPSPELVAAAGSHEGLQPTVATTVLVCLLAGLLGFVFLAAPVTLLNKVGADEPPAVLASRVEDLINTLEIAQPGAERAYGLRRDGDLLTRMRQQAPSPRSREVLLSTRPGPVTFWYRTAPDGFIPQRSPQRVSWENPPNTDPGMLALLCDARGRLEFLHRVPPREPAPTRGLIHWDDLFAAAGLRASDFRQTQPKHNPPDYCDEWAAWVSDVPAPEKQGGLYVEAGLLNGRPVYFAVNAAAAVAGLDSTDGDGLMKRATDLAERVWVGMLLVMLASSGLLAWRNLKLGRSDRRGAFRLAAFVFAAQLLAWGLTGAHGTSAGQFLRILMRHAADTMLFTMLTWLGYIAIEPHVRRRWPTVMIGWTRLLSGRYDDPLVARDALIGAAFGVCWAWTHLLPYGLAALVGTTPPLPTFGYASAQLAAAMGPPHWLAISAQLVFSALLWAILMLLFLFVLRTICRVQWAAVAVFVGLLMALEALQIIGWGGFGRADNIGEFVAQACLVVTITFLILRFGFLATAVASTVVGLLLAFPMTTNVDAWYFGATGFALLTVVVLVGAAFRASRTRQAYALPLAT